MTTPSLAIRPATTADHAAIRAVLAAAYGDYAAVMGPAAWGMYEANMREALADPAAGAWLVAAQAGAVVGCVLLVPPGPWGATAPEIRLLAVTPAARGLGLGRALMDACIARARAAGFPVIQLHTTPMMAVAKALYERMGFVPAPDLDFSPAPGAVVSGYRLVLREAGEDEGAGSREQGAGI